MESFLAYVRVSSYEQAERNLSIPSQVEQIKQYAINNWIKIKKVYQEEHSAFKWKRPVFHDMIKDLKKTSVWGLIVFKFDRISRNLDDFLKIDKIIRERNLEIVSVTEPMLNSYLGRYMVRDMQNRAILYSEELSFRIKLWLRKKLQSWGDIWWTPPYWFKRTKNGFFVVDDSNNKGNIVRAVFEMYGTWHYWYKQIARILKSDYSISHFSARKVEDILSQSMYYGVRTKKRRLSKEEYMFWWYDKAWTYIEEYELDYLQPLITKELFDKCKNIKDSRNKLKKSPTGVRRFPAVFVCSCGRNMRRDDKKNNRYLKCPNHVNNRFPVKCLERYTNLKRIEPEIDEIIRSLIPETSIRKELIDRINKEMKIKAVDKNRRISKSIHKHEELSDKLEEATDKFVEWIIDNKQYKLLSTSLQKKIDEIDSELHALKDFRSYTEAWKKITKFIQILEKYESYLNLKENNKKSSQRFGMLFHIVANLVVIDRNISSYQLSEPFNILKNSKNTDWWRWRESNPCLKGIYIHVYHYSHWLCTRYFPYRLSYDTRDNTLTFFSR